MTPQPDENVSPRTEYLYRGNDVDDLLWGDEFEQWRSGPEGKAAGVTADAHDGIVIFRGWIKQRVAGLDRLPIEREASSPALDVERTATLDVDRISPGDLADTLCFLDSHDRPNDRSACQVCEDFGEAMYEALTARLAAQDRSGEPPDDVRDVNALLDQFGDAVESKGLTLAEIDRRAQDRSEDIRR